MDSYNTIRRIQLYSVRLLHVSALLFLTHLDILYPKFINLPSIFKDKSVITSIPTNLFKISNPLSFVISIINLFVVLFLTITN